MERPQRGSGFVAAGGLHESLEGLLEQGAAKDSPKKADHEHAELSDLVLSTATTSIRSSPHNELEEPDEAAQHPRSSASEQVDNINEAERFDSSLRDVLFERVSERDDAGRAGQVERVKSMLFYSLCILFHQCITAGPMPFV